MSTIGDEGLQSAAASAAPIKKAKSSESDSGSGSENGEKPVREKLRDTELEEGKQIQDLGDSIMSGEESEPAARIKAARKRSLEGKDAVEGSQVAPSSIHARKRSRDARSKDAGRDGASRHAATPIAEDESETVHDASTEVTHNEQASGPGLARDQSLRKKRSRDDPNEDVDSDREHKIATTDSSRARRSSSEASADSMQQKATSQTTQSGTTENVLGDIDDDKDKPKQAVRRKHSKSSLDADFQEEEINSAANGLNNVSAAADIRAAAVENAQGSENVDTAPVGKEAGHSADTDSSAANQLPQTSSKAFASSGFASMTGSTSPFGSLGASSGLTSPFGALGGNSSTKADAAQSDRTPASSARQASQSAFTGSSFASLASTASPFGSSAAKPLTSFASAANAPSAFGASTQPSLGASTFGASSLASSMGGGTFGSGFGGGFGRGAKLSSFAAPVGDAKLGSSAAAKPFGAPADDADDGDGGTEDGEDGGAGSGDDPDDGIANNGPLSPGRGSPKYKIRDVNETGEEDEETIFSGRGKLYHFDGQQWLERGNGSVKLNLDARSGSAAVDDPSRSNHDEDDELAPRAARLIMRTAQTHKVILNTRVFKEMKFGDPNGGEPKNKAIHLSVPIDGKLVPHILRMQDTALQELYRRVKVLQSHM